MILYITDLAPSEQELNESRSMNVYLHVIIEKYTLNSN